MSLPPNKTFDDVRVRIRESVKNPNVGRIEQVVLKSGPRAFRLATLMEILDPKLGEIHHYSLKSDSIDKKKAGWFYKPEKSVRIDGNDPNEIERLFQFLHAHLSGKLSEADTDLHIIRSEDYEKLEKLLSHIPKLASPDMIELLKVIIPRFENLDGFLDELVEVFTNSTSHTVNSISFAAKYVEHKRIYGVLSTFVNTGDTNEQKYQDLLSKNPWIFGSEYSELLDRRKWTRDNNLDFMLRRTIDNYLEIVEIKTPIPDSLLISDKSHNSYHPSSKLSAVIGQVMKYIAEIERSRDSILSKDNCDTLKIRARIIIGLDGDELQQEALHNLNSHLHRIEIVTFDQLLRIARRVLSVFEDFNFPNGSKQDTVTIEPPF